MFNALLTGSQVYGIPHKDSDTDLVVLVSEKTIEMLAAAKGPEDFAQEMHYLEYTGSISLRFGKLNLICVTNEYDFETWRLATKHLKKMKPVTRKWALKYMEDFRREREAKRPEEGAE